MKFDLYSVTEIYEQVTGTTGVTMAYIPARRKVMKALGQPNAIKVTTALFSQQKIDAAMPKLKKLWLVKKETVIKSADLPVVKEQVSIPVAVAPTVTEPRPAVLSTGFTGIAVERLRKHKIEANTITTLAEVCDALVDGSLVSLGERSIISDQVCSVIGYTQIGAERAILTMDLHRKLSQLCAALVDAGVTIFDTPKPEENPEPAQPASYVTPPAGTTSQIAQQLMAAADARCSTTEQRVYETYEKFSKQIDEKLASFREAIDKTLRGLTDGVSAKVQAENKELLSFVQDHEAIHGTGDKVIQIAADGTVSLPS